MSNYNSTSSSSTSTKTNWILEKYSRSRPSSFSNASTTSNIEPDPKRMKGNNYDDKDVPVEWDH